MLDWISIEANWGQWQSELWLFGEVSWAAFLGGLIGLEREMADKPAGLRTHILVASASTLLMVLGLDLIEAFGKQEDAAVDADPIRIIQAIVVGISFLGAGTIVHHGTRNVEGLTTAASILLTAAIGVAVGAERFVLATVTTFFTLVVLLLVPLAERRMTRSSSAEGEGQESGGHKPAGDSPPVQSSGQNSARTS